MTIRLEKQQANDFVSIVGQQSRFVVFDTPPFTGRQFWSHLIDNTGFGSGIHGFAIFANHYISGDGIDQFQFEEIEFVPTSNLQHDRVARLLAFQTKHQIISLNHESFADRNDLVAHLDASSICRPTFDHHADHR